MKPNRASALPTFCAYLLTIAASACGVPTGAQPPKEPTMTRADVSKPSAVRTGHVPVRGVDYYYEVHGQGAPVLVLHGGFGSTALFEIDVAQLSKTHEVIAVDLQGHGR